MHLPRSTLTPPTGFSFDVPDLLMLHAWAEYHHLRMRIDLDIFTDGEEYEEVVTLSESHDQYQRWIIWRSTEGIVVQPSIGRRVLFEAMADALDLLIPAAD